MSKKDNQIGFIGKLRCKQWGCPDCINLRRQIAASIIHCGLGSPQRVRSNSIEEDISSYKNLNVSPLCHVATYSVADWERLKNRKPWRRFHPRYVSLRYDDRYYVIAASEIPDGKEVSAVDAFQQSLSWLSNMRPDFHRHNGEMKKHDRHCRPSRGWPHPDQAYHAQQFLLLGFVPRQREEILDCLDSWGQTVTDWQQLPQRFVWLLEYQLHNLPLKNALVLFRQLGLRPRKGETNEQLEDRLYGLFYHVTKTAA